jgi:hypothetical protein
MSVFLPMQALIILAGQQAGIVYLRYAGREELNVARDQVSIIVAVQSRIIRATNLMHVERETSVP